MIERFSELPGLIARQLDSYDHVIVVLLDAFGWTFVQRHQQHPLLQRIMQIHVAEEARHIGFAHMYLEQVVPRMNRAQKLGLSVAYPVVMRVLCDAILVPHKQMIEDMGLPKEVVKELWWTPRSRRPCCGTCSATCARSRTTST